MPKTPKLVLATIEMMIERLSIASEDMYVGVVVASGLEDSTRLGFQGFGWTLARRHEPTECPMMIVRDV